MTPLGLMATIAMLLGGAGIAELPAQGPDPVVIAVAAFTTADSAHAGLARRAQVAVAAAISRDPRRQVVPADPRDRPRDAWGILAARHLVRGTLAAHGDRGVHVCVERLDIMTGEIVLVDTVTVQRGDEAPALARLARSASAVRFQRSP